MRSKKAILNIISSIILQVITIVCGFIVPKLIIIRFGSSVNGLATSITQFLSYIVLLESGFGPVVKAILYKPIAKKDKATIEEILKSSENFFRKIALAFVIYILALCFILPQILSNEFNKIFTLSLVIIISISTFAEYYFGMTYKLYLEAEQKSYIIFAIQIGTIILNTIAVIVLIRFEASIQFIKLVTALIYILRPIFQNIYVRKKYNINLNNAKGDYKIEQKWDGLAQHVAYVINNNADIAILTLFSNTLEISVYYIYSLITNSIRNTLLSFTGGVCDSFGDMIAKGENENLNTSFKMLEEVYFTIATIAFNAAFFLILPFINLYMSGVNDVNYIRTNFAIAMILSRFVWTIRHPYEELTKTAGHFKQTKKGAWFEAICNIILSVALVCKYGLIGVVIGTLIPMVIRTIEFMYHTAKYILKRSIWYTFKRLIVIAIEFIIILLIINNIPQIEITGYVQWIIQAVIVTIISAIVIISINCMVYKENIKNIIEKVKRIKSA